MYWISSNRALIETMSQMNSRIISGRPALLPPSLPSLEAPPPDDTFLVETGRLDMNELKEFE
ncbi:MAG: hypothetical protein ABIL01_12730 [Pseudomonadota bacterium]